MAFNWINPSKFSINSFLLMDSWMLSLIFKDQNQKHIKNMGIVLRNNKCIEWYIKEQCPELKTTLEKIIGETPKIVDQSKIREAEEWLLDYHDSFIVYLYPETMNSNCDYLQNWDKNRLLSMADFTDKTILDVGSGTGGLAFAAAKYAKAVYAVEPANRLRKYLKDRMRNEGVSNVKVTDGAIEDIPYPDNMFDIVMSGHVWGDNYSKELEEMVRVVKDGGYIIDCPGEDSRKRDNPDRKKISFGFKSLYYKSTSGGDVYRYIKKIKK